MLSYEEPLIEPVDNIDEYNLEKDEEMVELLHEKDKASFYATAFNLLTSITGAGILTLGYGLSKIGYGLGTFCLVFFAFVSAFNCLALYRLIQITQKNSYSEMVESVFGNYGRKYVDFVQIAYSFGSIIGYTSLIGNQLSIVISRIAENYENIPQLFKNSDSNRVLVLITIPTLVLFPIALKKNFNALRYTSSIAICCVIYLSIVIISKASWNTPCGSLDDGSSYFQCSNNQCLLVSVPPANYFTTISSCVNSGCGQTDTHPQYSPVIIDFAALTSLPLFSFSFTAAPQFPPLIKEMSNPTPKRVIILIFCVLSFAMTLYISVSNAGYRSFCNSITGNVLDSFPMIDNYILSTRIAISGVLCCAFPLFSQVIRNVIKEQLTEKQQQSDMIHFIITAVIVLSVTLLALVCTSLDLILGLTGAFAGLQLLIVVPAAMFFKIHFKEGGFIHALPSLIVIVFGVSLTITSVVSTLAK